MCVCAIYSTMLEFVSVCEVTVTNSKRERAEGEQWATELAVDLKRGCPRAVGNISTSTPRAGTLATKRNTPKLPLLCERSAQHAGAF